MVLYNRIGIDYDETRQADPYIASKLFNFLKPEKNKSYIDIGCGSGNYTTELYNLGIKKITGVDVSDEMLNKARSKAPEINWIQEDIHSLDVGLFDGATCILATHHFNDLDKALTRIHMSISGGNFVIFTILSEQMRNYWLYHYFPETIKRSCGKFSSFERIKEALKRAGFVKIQKEEYFIRDDLIDLFIHSGKHKPEIYLNDFVMKGISCFNLWQDLDDEIKQGRLALKKDIESGEVAKIIDSYDDSLGDYCFIHCRKELS